MKRIRASTWDSLDDVTEDMKPHEKHPALVEFRPPQTAESLAAAKFIRSDMKSEPKAKDDENGNENDNMVAHVDGMKFVGERLPVDTFAAQTRTFIAVLEKATGELHMIETADFYRMRPREPLEGSANMDDDDAEEDNIEEDKNLTVAEKRANMLRLFGNKKSLKRYENYERKNKQIITSDAARAEAQKAADLVAENEAQNEQEGDGTSRHLVPPHNAETSDPTQAYPLEDLCPPECYEEFKIDSIKAIEELRGNNPQNPGWNSYTFLLLCQVAGDTIDDDVKLRRAVACFYLNMLVNIINGPPRIHPSNHKELSQKWYISEFGLGELLRMFMERQTGKSRNDLTQTTRSKDKIVYYAAVLWLTIGDFRNVQGLGKIADALKITHKEMAQFVQRVGGKLAKDKGTTASNYGKFRARLVTPLVFPSIKVEKRRRKSRRMND